MMRRFPGGRRVGLVWLYVAVFLAIDRCCYLNRHHLFSDSNRQSSGGVVLAMRLVLQRVKSASVTTTENGVVVSQIGPGVLALVGLHEHDTRQDLEYCCKRLLGCKLWDNEETGGQWRQSVKQKGYACLLVSQFTLYGTLSKKLQPDYKLAMKNVPAREMYRQFVELVRQEYQADQVLDGVFGAMMEVSLVNDGPVTLIIESNPQAPPPPALDDLAVVGSKIP